MSTTNVCVVAAEVLPAASVAVTDTELLPFASIANVPDAATAVVVSTLQVPPVATTE